MSEHKLPENSPENTPKKASANPSANATTNAPATPNTNTSTTIETIAPAFATASQDATVVIVHGIWMHGVLMRVLAYRLRKLGYRTRCISYPFLRKTPEENARYLARVVSELPTPVVHFAAHSLGGIVCLHYLNSGVDVPRGRTVLLGSPAQGSHVARRLHKRAFGRLILGKSVERGLLGGAPIDASKHKVGLIRGGTYPFKVWVRSDAEASDGVVLHSETALAYEVPVTDVKWSHSTLIFSATTASRAAEFFEHGEFSNTG